MIASSVHQTEAPTNNDDSFFGKLQAEILPATVDAKRNPMDWYRELGNILLSFLWSASFGRLTQASLLLLLVWR